MDVGPASEAIVRAGRRLGANGLISAGEGNLSIRLADGSLLVTPSGRRKDELEPADLVIVGPDDAVEPGGTQSRGDPAPVPTSDLAIHRAVHRARPDIEAVVHAHLPASMALTLAGEIPDPKALPETALFLPRLPFLAFGPPGSTQLAARVAAAFREPPEPLPGAVLLERHGAVAVGRTVDAAVDRLELVEVLCRTWRDALLVRAARRHVGRDGWPLPGDGPHTALE